MKSVAGIDLGTQSMKVVIYDYEKKKIVETSSSPMSLISEKGGVSEQKAEWYKEGLISCFSQISNEAKSTVKAIGVSGQQHGFVPLDEKGEALYNVKLWNDTSTVEEGSLLLKAVGGEKKAFSEVQNFFLPGFTAPKILWLKRHKKESFSRLRYVMLPHDYINFLLTGNYKTECGDASGTALFNIKKRVWSKKVCDAIDKNLISLLPPLIQSDEVQGQITKEAAHLLSLPEGALVSSGGGDNMMGAIGTGVVSQGKLAMSMGTSGTLFGFSEKPVANPGDGISGFCSSSGGYLPLLCTMNCTVASEKIRTLLGMDVKTFDAEAEKALPGSSGVFVLPFFNGERTPNLPNGKASITGLTSSNTSKANIARSALESAVFAIRGGQNAFKKEGFKATELRLTGGGAKSGVWRQIVSDILNLPVKVPVSSEAAAFGASLQALWCLEKSEGKNTSIESIAETHVLIDDTKTVRPIEENVKVYDVAFKEYSSLVDHVSPLYR